MLGMQCPREMLHDWLGRSLCVHSRRSFLGYTVGHDCLYKIQCMMCVARRNILYGSHKAPKRSYILEQIAVVQSNPDHRKPIKTDQWRKAGCLSPRRRNDKLRDEERKIL